MNLLLPFARRRHFEAASEADVVVTFWGRPRRRTSKTWIHQCGSAEEALLAQQAGADAVIAQGVEAGGHVRGTVPALELLARVRDALPDPYPVLSAGGIADAADVKERLDAGSRRRGLRHPLPDERGERRPRRLQGAPGRRAGDVLTELFGAGWPAPHRVVANEATARWLRGDPRGPGWVRVFHRATAPALSRIPVPMQVRMAGTQKPGPADLRPRRGDRGRTAEPRRSGTAVRRRVHRPDR